MAGTIWLTSNHIYPGPQINSVRNIARLPLEVGVVVGVDRITGIVVKSTEIQNNILINILKLIVNNFVNYLMVHVKSNFVIELWIGIFEWNMLCGLEQIAFSIY